ncbi:AAA family ATPase [Nonomuraea typhae]|uniref:nSTAND1 domain-containing NTPase n=1 Tax=Nonomuraea typhae TaxID=2603600 RepID=UPI0012F77BF4|nr:AAA family ATPase [Nonomuraea typhae]
MPTYRELAHRAGYSATALQGAARGDRLPSLAVTLAFAGACGGDQQEWEQRWRTTEALLAIAPDILDTSAVTCAAGETPRAKEANGAPQAPYVGLAGYGVRDTDRFFGRDELVAGLLEQLRERRFLALVGPSGSGKSSLLRAGLIPAARARLLPGATEIGVIVFAPGRSPLTALYEALATAGTGPASGAAPAQPNGEDGLAAGDLAGGDLTELADRFGALPAGPKAELLVVVDQFEEVFALCPSARERAAFASVLVSARWAGSRVRVVLGLRADFYGHCAAHRALAQALQAATVLVTPMSAAELRQVVVKPAALQHVMVEPALVATIVAETADQPGALPLVSHALLETWRRRRGKNLTLHAYHSAGGIHGAIAQTAEAAYVTLSPDQQDAARRLLLRLITVDADGQVTRRPLPRADLSGTSPPEPGLPDSAHTPPALNERADGDTAGRLGAVLDRLTHARLITADAQTVQLAHEAVITSWPRLRDWVAADRQGLRIRQQLAEATSTWRELGRDPSGLYQGARLALTRDWAAHNDHAGLTADERAFLDASISADEARQVAVRRISHRFRTLSAALGVLLLLVSSAAVLAVQQRQLAEHELAQSQSRELAAQAQRAAGTNTPRALRLAGDAYRRAPTAEARSSLLSITAVPRASVHLNDPGQGQDPNQRRVAAALAFSPDARLLAYAERQAGPVRIWNTESGALVATIGHKASAITFSPDGKRLAFEEEEMVWVWDLPTNQPVTKLAYTTSARTLAFSFDGRQIAAQPFEVKGDEKRTAEAPSVTVWDIASRKTTTYRGAPAIERLKTAQATAIRARALGLPTGDQPFPFPLFPDYSHDGSVRLELEDYDVGVSVIEALTGKKEWYGDTRSWVSAISPGGHLLYLGHKQGQISLWNVAEKKPSATVQSYPGDVIALTLSQDGRLLATADHTGVIAIHDRASLPLIGHTNPIRSIAYAPDSKRITTLDQVTARTWDLATRRAGTFLLADPSSPEAAAYSPDGRILVTSHSATSKPDARIRLWDSSTGEQLGTLPFAVPAYAQQPNHLAFSSTGRTLLGRTADGHAYLWDMGSNTLLQGAVECPGAVFTPQGDQLICLHQDRLVAQGIPAKPLTPSPPTHTDPARTSEVRSAYSPGGRHLATLTDSKVTLWDAQTRTKIPAPPNTPAPARAVAFSSDGRLLAIAGSDGSILLWDLEQRTTWATLTGHTGAVTTLAFSPDGTTLASGSTDQTVIVWPLNPESVLR